MYYMLIFFALWSATLPLYSAQASRTVTLPSILVLPELADDVNDSIFYSPERHVRQIEPTFTNAQASELYAFYDMLTIFNTHINTCGSMVQKAQFHNFPKARDLAIIELQERRKKDNYNILKCIFYIVISAQKSNDSVINSIIQRVCDDLFTGQNDKPLLSYTHATRHIIQNVLLCTNMERDHRVFIDTWNQLTQNLNNAQDMIKERHREFYFQNLSKIQSYTTELKSKLKPYFDTNYKEQISV